MRRRERALCRLAENRARGCDGCQGEPRQVQLEAYDCGPEVKGANLSGVCARVDDVDVDKGLARVAIGILVVECGLLVPESS
eukprot:1741021-Rhodomonas_salina.1